MSLDAILEVAIGLVFAWLVLSAAASQVQEYFNNVFHLRAAYLAKGIKNLLADPTLVDKFFAHPVIQALCEQNPKTGTFRKPSYIPAAKFAEAALDVMMAAGQALPSGSLPPDQVQAQLAASASSPNLIDHLFPDVGEKVLSTEYTLAYARTQLEQQFDASMERVTGWYKRYQQVLSLVIGLVLALALNVDSVQIATQLWTQPTQRQMLVAQVPNASQSFPDLYKQAQNFNLPIGWATQETDCQQVSFIPGGSTYPGFGGSGGTCRRIVNLPAMNDALGWLAKIFGILVSALAAGQGAGFWFNALGKLIGLRGSGPVPAPAHVETPQPESFPTPPATPAAAEAQPQGQEQPPAQPPAPQVGQAVG